jgi:glycosyltransferase involved in cell wall biosynthesis
MTLRNIKAPEWRGVKIVPYRITRALTPTIHPWVSDFEAKANRGEACFRAALQLKTQGFTPDVIIAHPGWGESLFLKDVWPRTKLGIYCEFFYHAQGADVGFDPEFPHDYSDDVCKIRLKNLNYLLHFETADAGLSPTHWQAGTFPDTFRKNITVVHDGIDTVSLAPNPQVSLTLNDHLLLGKDDEVITFVNRTLEPYRGYHSFMRALPELLRQRPKANILIVGGSEGGYGAKPASGVTWKEQFAAEVRPQISGPDFARVHFLGNIPHKTFITLLQVSTVHVYLTYPFVLSWSLLEAMSIGCAIVASDTYPLHEAIRHNETGILINFFDSKALTESVCALIDNAAERSRLGQNARQFAQANYDLIRICLPQQIAWVNRLLEPKHQPLPSSTNRKLLPMPTFLHVGCGRKRKAQTTRAFNSPEWQELRLDIDETVQPDLVGTMVDMSSVASESVDAIFSSHNIEHLYPYEVPIALKEFLRVLKPHGYLVLTCPDLQSVCQLIADDKLTEPAYTAPAGPIAPIDILFGHRPQLENGNHYMAHKCGFTKKVLTGTLLHCGFKSIVAKSRGITPYFDLWAVASKDLMAEDVIRTIAEAHFPK